MQHVSIFALKLVEFVFLLLLLDLGWVFRRLVEYHTRLRMMRSLRDSLHSRIAARLEAKVGLPRPLSPPLTHLYQFDSQLSL
jgi:hypothetical protein